MAEVTFGDADAKHGISANTLARSQPIRLLFPCRFMADPPPMLHPDHH
jgi:hypothetical protein